MPAAVNTTNAVPTGTVSTFHGSGTWALGTGALGTFNIATILGLGGFLITIQQGQLRVGAIETGSPRTAALDMGTSGSYSYSFDVELVGYMRGEDFISGSDTTFFQAGAGEVQLPTYDLVPVWRLKQGGSYSVSASGNTSATITGTISAGWPINSTSGTGTTLKGYSVNGQIQLTGLTTTTSTLASSMTIGGVTETYGGGGSYGGSGWTVDCSSGLTVTDVGGAGDPVYQFAWTMPKRADVYGAINTWEVAHPANPRIILWNPDAGTLAGPTAPGFVGAVSVDLFNWSVSLPSGYGNHAHYDGDRISAAIYAPDLTAAGDDSTETQLCFRLPAFNAISLAQAATAAVDPCNSTSGWSSNVSVVSGILRVDSGSLSGIATRSFPGNGNSVGAPVWGVNCEGYRYLEIDVKPGTHSGGTLNITITPDYPGAPTYYWTPTLGAAGSFTKIRIDLMSPTGSWPSPAILRIPGNPAGGTYDERWPIGSWNSPVAEGDTWGINNIVTLNLGFPSGSGTYDIDFIRLARDNNPRLTIARSAHPFQQQLSGGNGLLNYRNILCTTDGRNSLDFFGYGGMSNVQSWPTLLDFIAWTGALPGWTATYLPASTPWYWLPHFAYFGGGGAITSGAAPGSYQFDQSFAGTLTIKSQVEVFGTYLVPGMGAMLQGGGAGTRASLYFQKFLRGRAHGVSIDKTHSPIVGATVTLKEEPAGTNRGTGTTDAKGYYITGSAYPKSLYNHDIIASGAGMPSDGTTKLANQAFYHRHIARCSFDANGNAEQQPYIIHDPYASEHQVTVSGGDLVYRRSDHSVPLPTWAIANTITSFGDVVRGSMASTWGTQRLEIIFERNNAGSGNHEVWTSHSDDDGATWSAAVLLVSNARNPYIAAGKDGSMLMSWVQYDSGTSGPSKAYAQFRAKGDLAWSTTFNFSTGGGTPLEVADLGFGNQVMAPDGQARWLWAFVVQGESLASTWMSNDDARTWTRLTP